MHSLVSQALRHRVPEQMRIDALGEAGLLGDFLHDLLDAPRGVVPAARRGEEVTRPPAIALFAF